MLKRFSAFLALTVLALPFIGHADAQALKVGYTDHEVIIANMPEYQDVQKELQDAYQNGQKELQDMYADYQDKLQKYQKQQSLLTQERRTEREKELNDLQQQIQQKAQEKDQALSQHESELMKPILDKVQAAINKVAQEKGLDIVLRSQVGQQPVLLYVNNKTVTDITTDVALELGLDVGQDSTSTAPTSSK